MPVPDLEPHCGSWIIIDPDTGAAVCETFYRETARRADANGFTVITAAQHLASFNRNVTSEE